MAQTFFLFKRYNSRGRGLRWGPYHGGEVVSKGLKGAARQNRLSPDENMCIYGTSTVEFAVSIYYVS